MSHDIYTNRQRYGWVCYNEQGRTSLGHGGAPSYGQYRHWEDILVKDQPTGYDWHASLPDGVRNIQTRLYWQPAEPTMLGNEQKPQKLGNEREARPKEKVRVVVDDRLSPFPTFGRASDPPANEAFPTEAQIKQKGETRS